MIIVFPLLSLEKSGNSDPALSITGINVPSFSEYPFEGFSLTVVPENIKYPLFFGNTSKIYFSYPVKESSNASTCFLDPSKGYSFIILLKATFTFD